MKLIICLFSILLNVTSGQHFDDPEIIDIIPDNSDPQNWNEPVHFHQLYGDLSDQSYCATCSVVDSIDLAEHCQGTLKIHHEGHQHKFE